MKKTVIFHLLCLVVGIFLGAKAIAQSKVLAPNTDKYWVFFTDKNNTTFSPLDYFHPKAIERRIKNNLPLKDYTDYPLCQNYIDSVQKIAQNIYVQSRWFNAISIKAAEEQIEQLKKYSFVKKIQPILIQTYPCIGKYGVELNESETELLSKQITHLQGEYFKQNNIDGSGVRIAVFDAGFPNVDFCPAFKHIRDNNRIIKTYDFAKQKEFVYDYNAHGTMVLSCIGGIINGKNIGLATGAEFLLARTEIEREPLSEEENWLSAVEWADKNGADIINSSLGYTFHRYFKDDMDGHTSLVVKAANRAATKGILVVNAMGNDANTEWRVVSTPADSDSVFSIGGIDPDTDFHITFSSLGPTADMRKKPNVSAYAVVIAAGKSKLKQTQGTSFSSPLIAGFAACVMQLKPDLNNMQVIRAIEQSASLYPYFDYAHGYGIPQAAYFFTQKTDTTINNIHFNKKGHNIEIKINETSIDQEANNYLYYHIVNENNIIEKYFVVNVTSNIAAKIFLNDYDNPKIIRACYKSEVKELKLK